EIIGNPQIEPELFRSISPVFHADRVKIPVMFVQGGRDKYSSLTDVNQFVQTLKNNHIPVKFLYKEEEGKLFKKDENIISYYLEIEDFLQKYMK
ncbi:S9 family peptidase, partial [Klebsiella pneumoniae]